MLQNNKFNVIISILAALAIWAYVVVVINPDETKTIKDVPVTLTNVDTLQDRGLTLVDENSYTVDVVIKGARSDITQVSVDNIEAVANVFGFPEGENEVQVVVTVPEKVSKEEIKPSFITVVVDEYVTASKSIKIRYDGEFAENTEPGFVSMIPEEIEVSGAKSVVETVTHVEALMSSDNVKDEESTVEVEAVPIDNEGKEVEGLKLSQDQIAITSTLTHIKTVPLEVPVEGEVSSDYEVTATEIPESVTIKGIKSQIDSIDKLTSEPIDISNVTETTEIPLEFDLPDKVQLAETSRDISVVVEISGISVKEFTLKSSEIQITGVRDGYQASIEDSDVRISVYGIKSIIDSIDANDLRISVDLSEADYSAGEYSATIKYAVNYNVNEIKIRPEKIQVIINEAG